MCVLGALCKYVHCPLYMQFSHIIIQLENNLQVASNNWTDVLGPVFNSYNLNQTTKEKKTVILSDPIPNIFSQSKWIKTNPRGSEDVSVVLNLRSKISCPDIQRNIIKRAHSEPGEDNGKPPRTRIGHVNWVSEAKVSQAAGPRFDLKRQSKEREVIKCVAT